MSDEFDQHKTFKTHRAGRQPFEPAEHPWPVVSKTMLAKESELGPTGPDDNPLVVSLLRGYVMLVNSKRHLEVAYAFGCLQRPKNEKLVERLKAELARAQQVIEDWPLTIL